ncbi:MAG: porin family protein [Candidatus Cyclobacteriaceae bacterium M2_1C_046]
MKRFLIIFLLGLSTVCNAQNLGITAGINFSNLTGDIDTVTFKLGFQAGALVEFQVGGNLFIQPELVFTLQGAIDNDDPEQKVSLNYVALPVMVKYFISEGFNLQIGPRVAVLAMAQTTIGETDYQIKDQLASTDIGIISGIGYQKKNFKASVRYYHGLTDIKEADNQDISNQAIEFSLGYFFNRNKNPDNGLRRFE